ncbi:hypothetical protein QIS74_05913 [Colletotrichum tabaci]|uniref:Uncharacterized protein n=1 Tax=Colletotrichum tabaci TaxID=1209068 RepID=A0AAV9TIV6_9PEZI
MSPAPSLALSTSADKYYFIRRTDEMPPGSMEDSGKMAVTGPVIEGGPNVTLYKTDREVYDQILAFNPHTFDDVAVGTTPVPKRGLPGPQRLVHLSRKETLADI